jgi:hypothetical protein
MTTYFSGNGAFESVIKADRVIGYHWNPDTLAYEVNASHGSGTGQEVEVTNWPSVYPAQMKTGDATYQVPRLDKYTHATTTIDYVHHEIHDGATYMYHDVIDDLDNNVAQDYMITTPDTTKWLHISHDIEAIGPITVEIYEATDKTGTTAQTLYNRDRNSATTATGTIHKGTSGGTTDGTKIVYWKGGISSNKTQNSATHGTASEKILKQNTKYILRLTSRMDNNMISVSIGWYEHTNKTA